MEQWYYKQIAPRARSLAQSSDILPFKISLIIFIISRLYFLTIAFFSPNFVKLDTGYIGSQVSQGELNLIWVWANMDGRHFIKIATEGYSGTNFAYFPLYPLLINLITRVGLTPILSGIFISLLATALAVHYLLKLIDLDKLKISKLETLFLLFFFPFSFILNSVYADALFLFMTIGSFYFARSKRWFISGAFAFFASLTRLTGVALIPALALEWWLQRKNKKVSWSGLIAPLGAFLGFIAYPLYLQFQFGNWRLFQSSFSAWKQDQFVLLPQVIFRYLKILTTVSPDLLVYWIAALELTSFCLYLLLSIYVMKKVRLSYGLFMATVLLLVTFTGTLAGTPRYLIHLFPAFIGLAFLLKNHPRLRLIYYSATIVLGVLITTFFVQGYFVG